MTWTGSTLKLASILNDLNVFHPNLHFTHQQPSTSIDFLDLTIYKGFTFPCTNLLDTKNILTYTQNVHFTSDHPMNMFKAIIKGECIRCVRTNTTYETYATMVHTFRAQLRKRN